MAAQAPVCERRSPFPPAPRAPLPLAFLMTNDTFTTRRLASFEVTRYRVRQRVERRAFKQQHLQPRVVRRQRVGGDAAAGFCEYNFKRVDICRSVLARVLEVTRVLI